MWNIVELIIVRVQIFAQINRMQLLVDEKAWSKPGENGLTYQSSSLAGSSDK